MSIMCPFEGCGRILENELVLIEHFKRRHPNQQLPSQIGSKAPLPQKKSESTILPKIVHRKSLSKDRKEKVTEELSKTNKTLEVNEIITASRKTVTIGQPRKLRLTTASSTSQLTIAKNVDVPKPTTPFVQERREEKRPSLAKKQEPLVESGQKEKDKVVGLKRKLSLRKDKDLTKKVSNQGSELIKYTSTATVVGTSIPITIPKQKKTLLRPRSIERRSIEMNKEKSLSILQPIRVSTAEVKPTYNKQDESETLIIKLPTKIFKPQYYTIEILYLNNIGLQSLSLEGLQFLYEISIEGNCLTNMDFLEYEDNENIGIVRASFNKISQIYLPPNIETLSITNNNIEDLESLTLTLKSNSTLESLDVTNNPVSSIYNFKFEILLNANKLIKLNSNKVLNVDIDAALQYKAIIDRKPQSKTKASAFYQRFKDKLNMTATSGFGSINLYKEQENIKLEKELVEINSKIKEVRKGLQIIEDENETLKRDISRIKTTDIDYEEIESEYKQLQMEMQTLELMNFLKYSTKEELGEMILDMHNKIKEIGCQ